MRIPVTNTAMREKTGRGGGCPFSACNYIHNELIYMYVHGD